MRTTVAITAAFLLALPFGSATAACPDRNANPNANASGQYGMSKNGARAPLETDTNNPQAANPAQKSGGTMPLANQQGGGDKNLATSQSDVESQQKGGKTAAAQANEDKCKD